MSFSIKTSTKKISYRKYINAEPLPVLSAKNNFYIPTLSISVNTLTFFPLFNYTFSDEVLTINGHLNINPMVDPPTGVLMFTFDIPTGFEFKPFSIEDVTTPVITTGSIVNIVPNSFMSPYSCNGIGSGDISQSTVTLSFYRGTTELVGTECALSFNVSFRAIKL